MRLLIISDIHCLSKDIDDGKGYGGLTGSDFYVEERHQSRNPILAVDGAISKTSLEIDVLVCLGDIAHQSKRLPFMQAWRDLHQLSTALRIPKVVAVTGNHDVLSRAEDISDAESRVEFLRSVVPSFPCDEEAARTSYFSTGVASLLINDLCLIVIDTCRVHGLGSSADTSKKIWEVGHITLQMRQQVIDTISYSTATHFVIVMHHHPDRVDDINDIHNDAMQNGAQFIKDIGDLGRNCIILHGHKHQVNLKHGSHGVPAPIIFSAATFAAKPYPSQIRGFENLFHVLELDMQERRFPAGAIYSWNWNGAQWGESRHLDMPFHLPFGRQIDIAQIADCLGNIPIPATNKLTSIELLAQCPDLKFVQMNQVDALNRKLASYRRSVYMRHSKIDAMLED